MELFLPRDQQWMAGSAAEQLLTAGCSLGRIPNCWSLGHNFVRIKIDGRQQTSPATELIPRVAPAEGLNRCGCSAVLAL